MACGDIPWDDAARHGTAVRRLRQIGGVGSAGVSSVSFDILRSILIIGQSRL